MLAQRERVLGLPAQERERRACATRVERDEEPAAAAEQAGVRRQTRHVGRLELHAHVGQARTVFDGGPLAERQQQSREDHGRAFVLSGKGQQPIDPVPDAVVGRWRVDQVRDEGEQGGEPGETVPRGGALDQRAREGSDVAVAGQREGEIVEDRPRVLGAGGRGLQRGFSSSSSRLITSASWLSFRHFA